MRHKPILLISLLSLILLFTGQRQAVAQKIYLLTAADTKDPNIGISDERDMTNIYQAFWSQVPEEQLVLYNQSHSYPDPPAWKGPELRQNGDMKNAILEAISRCPAGPNDTIIFYWSGHGGFNDQGGHYRHYLKMPNDVLLNRQDIVAAIQRKSPRLAVVISDSCNTMFESMDLRTEVPSPAMEPAMVISPLFDSLFICHKGLVDINASSKNQSAEIAQCTPTYGGLFTGALAFAEEKFEMRNGEERPTGKGIDIEVKNTFGWTKKKNLPMGYFWTHTHKREDWNDLIAHVDRIMEKHWHRETKQKVYAWSLPHKLTTHRNRNDSSIPSVLSLTRNDVILSINGGTIYDEDDCRRAIRASGKIMEFTVRDSRDGTVWRMQSRLRDNKPRFGVYLDDARGGGALVTDTRFGSPATNNKVLEKVKHRTNSAQQYTNSTPSYLPSQPSYTPSTSSGSAKEYYLRKNDVILTINGSTIHGTSDYKRKVRQSESLMRFTVRDAKDGHIYHMETTLRDSSPRFGILCDDARGGGVYVLGTNPGSPCMSCRLIGVTD